jgi:hypothetical protein
MSKAKIMEMSNVTASLTDENVRLDEYFWGQDYVQPPPANIRRIVSIGAGLLRMALCMRLQENGV